VQHRDALHAEQLAEFLLEFPRVGRRGVRRRRLVDETRREPDARSGGRDIDEVGIRPAGQRDEALGADLVVSADGD
jgi:hypothetical protein